MVFLKICPVAVAYDHMKNITIIGSGNIGGNLARLLASKHNITLGSRNPEQTRAKFKGFTPVN